MRRLVPCIAVLLLLSQTCLAADETWLRISLDGRKIGHLHGQREVIDDVVETRQTMQLGIERDGILVELVSEEQTRESVEGKPLGFAVTMSMAGSISRTRGSPAGNDLWTVELEQGGHPRSMTLQWPAGALLNEGQRLAELRADRRPGSQYSVLAFDPSSLQALQIESTVAARESLRLPEGERSGLRIEQRILMGDAPTSSTSWVDEDGAVLRTTLGLFGLELELLACSRECALAPNQSTDILALSSVASPRALGREERQSGLRYRMRGNQELVDALAAVPGQSLRQVEDGLWILSIDPGGTQQSRPDASLQGPNRWLQSDDAGLIEIAQQASAGARDERQRMQLLQAFVARHIEKKSLRIGYASALEVLDLREGDCTEHAVLLAALARALNIPALVASGMAYTDSFAGQTRSFVPHAWVMAWVEGEWHGFDAALGEYGAGHIALSVGDGEPFRFYRGIEALGTLRLESVTGASDSP